MLLIGFMTRFNIVPLLLEGAADRDWGYHLDDGDGGFYGQKLFWDLYFTKSELSYPLLLLHALVSSHTHKSGS